MSAKKVAVIFSGIGKVVTSYIRQRGCEDLRSNLTALSRDLREKCAFTDIAN